MADTLLGGIVINEILAVPNSGSSSGFDTNGDGAFSSTDEYIEILNTSAVAIDISGVELWDDGSGNWFTFPPGTILQPGAHAMVMAGFEGTPLTGAPGDLFFYANRNGAVLNNGGDNVVLRDPGTATFISATYNGGGGQDATTNSGWPGGTQIGAGEDFGPEITGSSIQREPDGADTFTNNQTPTPGTQNVCFTGGTLFQTSDGPTLIEHLRPGDRLWTHGNGYQTIRWIWAKTRTASALAQNPKLRPVRIRQGALGNALPERDLMVSLHHRILVASKIADRMFGHSEVLVPAKDLLKLDGVEVVDDHKAVTYYHILFDRHEVIFAEGIPAESLYLGAEAIKAMHPNALTELCDIFEVDELTLASMGVNPARPLVAGKRARQLAYRHEKNAKPFFGTMPVGAYPSTSADRAQPQL